MTDDRQPAPTRRAMRLEDWIEAMFRRGRTFQEVRRALNARGLKLDYTGHDRQGGRAMARRARQMERGVIPAVCSTLNCGQPVPKGRETRVCDDCLAAKWGAGRVA